MIVVGLDLSLSCTGIAVIDDGKLVDTHRVKSTGMKDAPVSFTAARIHGSMRLIANWVAETAGCNPDLAVIESPSFASTGGMAHERGGLWWGVAGGLTSWGVPLATVSPKTRAIYAVGHGRGKGPDGKREVKLAVQARYGHMVAIPDDNVADAVVLAAMGARFLGEPIDELPDSHTRAMGSAKWPS